MLLEAVQVAGGPGGWLEQEVNRLLDQIRDAAVADRSRACVQGDSGILPCPLELFQAQETWLRTLAEQYAVAAAGLSMPGRLLMPGSALNPASLVPQLTPGSLARTDVRLSVAQTRVAD